MAAMELFALMASGGEKKGLERSATNTLRILINDKED